MKLPWWLVLLILLAISAGSIWASRALFPPEPEIIPPLPPEIVERIVEVEVVKEIPGPVQVVEKIKVVTETKEVPVDVVRTVRELVEVAGPDPDIDAQIVGELNKWQGYNTETRELTIGWTGDLKCQISVNESPWVELATLPLDRSHTVALQEPIEVERYPREAYLFAGLTSGPGWTVGGGFYGKGKRIGYWVQASEDFSEDALVFDDFSSRFSSMRVAGGVAFRF